MYEGIEWEHFFNVQYPTRNVQQGMSNIQQGMSNVQQGMSNIQQGMSNVQVVMGLGIPYYFEGLLLKSWG